MLNVLANRKNLFLSPFLFSVTTYCYTSSFKEVEAPSVLLKSVVICHKSHLELSTQPLLNNYFLLHILRTLASFDKVTRLQKISITY